MGTLIDGLEDVEAPREPRLTSARRDGYEPERSPPTRTDEPAPMKLRLGAVGNSVSKKNAGASRRVR